MNFKLITSKNNAWSYSAASMARTLRHCSAMLACAYGGLAIINEEINAST